MRLKWKSVLMGLAFAEAGTKLDSLEAKRRLCTAFRLVTCSTGWMLSSTSFGSVMASLASQFQLHLVGTLYEM